MFIPKNVGPLYWTFEKSFVQAEFKKYFTSQDWDTSTIDLKSNWLNTNVTIRDPRTARSMRQWQKPYINLRGAWIAGYH